MDPDETGTISKHAQTRLAALRRTACAGRFEPFGFGQTNSRCSCGEAVNNPLGMLVAKVSTSTVADTIVGLNVWTTPINCATQAGGRLRVG
jgi:hypothetical protein